MLFDRIGEDRPSDGQRTIRRRRNLAVEPQVEAQRRRMAARAAALG